MNRFASKVRASFWFIPAAMSLAAIVLAHALLIVDEFFAQDGHESLLKSLSIGPDGARGLLTTVGGSILGVAGVTFSITVSVIATASSTYGPRLVRNFMNDRRNQIVLGIFVSTVVYTWLILRTITTADAGVEAFVPIVSVYFALLLGLGDLGALIYFLHHISSSIQVAPMVQRVRSELESVVESEYPEPDTQTSAASKIAEQGDRQWHIVTPECSGYVVNVDRDRLLELLAEADARVRIIATPGVHVMPGEALAASNVSAADLVDSIRACFHIETVRSPEQDLLFALDAVVEVAVRALSPSMNDPYTACNVIDELGPALSTVVAKPAQSRIADTNGVVRIEWTPAATSDVLDRVFSQIRCYGASDILVVKALLRLIGRLLPVAGDSEVTALLTHADLIMDTARESEMPSHDFEKLQRQRTELDTRVHS